MNFRLYFTIPQSRGDRLYLEGSLKVKLEVVKLLKKMNVEYPRSHEDYDEKFLITAIAAIFAEDELNSLSKAKSLKVIYGRKYVFLKSTYNSRISKRSDHEFNVFSDFITYFHRYILRTGWR